MRLEQLHYIVVIAQCQSFSKAADRLFLSPQALSRSVTSLEKELGLTLFNRFATGVQLTSVGELIAAMAERILDDFNHTMTECYKSQDTVQERIVYLYTHNVYLEAYINQLVLKFINAQPRNKPVKIVIQMINSYTFETVRQKSNKGDHNWMLFASLNNETAYNSDLLKELLAQQDFCFIDDERLMSKYVACVSHDNLLSAQQTVSLKMLSEMPWVRFQTNIPEGEPMLFHDFPAQYLKGQPLQSPYIVDNLFSWLNAIAAGIGVGLIDGFVAGRHSDCKDWFNRLAILNISDAIYLRHGFFVHRQCPQDVLDFVRFALQELKMLL